MEAISYKPLFHSARSVAGEAATRPEEANIDTYEAMLIVIPELDEEQIGSTVARFQTVIERTSGEVSESRQWGRRKLAYEIDNRSDGYYAILQFTTGERTLTELKRILRVSDDVLRHMIVKLPPDYVSSQQAEISESSESNESFESAENDETAETVQVSG